MATKTFVNLPVKDLKKTVDFFSQIGFKFNPMFTDEKATCMIVSRDSYIMFLLEKFFKSFTKKQLADATKSTEVIIALSAESREKVDEIFNRAIEAGGSESNKMQDEGWMYGRSFQDINGHMWEVIWMDRNKIKEELASAEESFAEA